jgi:hypothetical protein
LISECYCLALASIHTFEDLEDVCSSFISLHGQSFHVSENEFLEDPDSRIDLLPEASKNSSHACCALSIDELDSRLSSLDCSFIRLITVFNNKYMLPSKSYLSRSILRRDYSLLNNTAVCPTSLLLDQSDDLSFQSWSAWQLSPGPRTRGLGGSPQTLRDSTNHSSSFSHQHHHSAFHFAELSVLTPVHCRHPFSPAPAHSRIRASPHLDRSSMTGIGAISPGGPLPAGRRPLPSARPESPLATPYRPTSAASSWTESAAAATVTSHRCPAFESESESESAAALDGRTTALLDQSAGLRCARHTHSNTHAHENAHQIP